MKKDIRTTSCTIKAGEPVPQPISPPGKGWSFRGGASAFLMDKGMVQHQWFWERDASETQSDEGEYLTQEKNFSP